MARKAPVKNLTKDNTKGSKKKAEIVSESKEEVLSRVKGELLKSIIIAVIALAAGIGISQLIRI